MQVWADTWNRTKSEHACDAKATEEKRKRSEAKRERRGKEKRPKRLRERATLLQAEAERERAEASARGEARRGENAGVADGCKGLACMLHAAARQTRGERSEGRARASSERLVGERERSEPRIPAFRASA